MRSVWPQRTCLPDRNRLTIFPPLLSNSNNIANKFSAGPITRTRLWLFYSLLHSDPSLAFRFRALFLEDIHTHSKKMDNNNNLSKDWVTQKLTGNGIYTYANGDTYAGDFVNDLKHGEGRLQEKNGNIYTGSWRNDKMSGQGKKEWHDGGQFDGDIYEG